MQALRDQIHAIENRRKTLDVYTDREATVSELAAQFSTRNVDVSQNTYSAGDGPEFIVIRNEDGEAEGAIGIERFRKIISPDIHPPWQISETDANLTDLFDFLDGTLFTSFNRQQMLAVSPYSRRRPHPQGAPGFRPRRKHKRVGWGGQRGSKLPRAVRAGKARAQKPTRY